MLEGVCYEYIYTHHFTESSSMLSILAYYLCTTRKWDKNTWTYYYKPMGIILKQVWSGESWEQERASCMSIGLHILSPETFHQLSNWLEVRHTSKLVTHHQTHTYSSTIQDIRPFHGTQEIMRYTEVFSHLFIPHSYPHSEYPIPT